MQITGQFFAYSTVTCISTHFKSVQVVTLRGGLEFVLDMHVSCYQFAARVAPLQLTFVNRVTVK